jgi:hyaluronan synthase
VWDTDTLTELKKPFRDPRVGGVTTNQRIFGRERNVLSRCADWMEDIRATYSLPAMSVLGQVGCLPGRTIALRRDIVADNADRFLTERFLGIHLEISDDRTLTNYALQAGYRTVFQRSSRVWTDTPTELGRYVRQQYRWARGSQYNTLRMSGFMLRHTPFLAYCFFTDILIPFAWFGTLVNLAWKFSVGDPVNYTTIPPWGQAALVVVGVMCSYALRNLSHLRRHPGDLAYLPVFVVFLAGISLIRLYGFFRCGEEAAWGTRKHAHAGTGQVSPLGMVPMYLGLAGVVVAAGIGPMLETRPTFMSEVDQHAVVLAVVASAVLAALVTMTVERYLRMRRNAARQPVGAEAADVAASPAHRSSSSEHSRD